MKLLLFITFTCWLYLIIGWITHRRRSMQTRVEDAILGTVEVKSNPKKAVKVTQVRSLARKIAANSIRRFSNHRLEKLQHRLMQAGSPGNMTVTEWIGTRFIVTGVCSGVGLLLVWLSHGQLASLALLLAFVLFGWIGPDFWLSRRIKMRQAALLRELPNALDLLTVSVEAGLGFDQAVARVAEKLKGALGEEFERALREMQLGSQRVTALQRLATRTGVDAIRSFVSAVVQADRLGVGLAQVLRVQSAEVRRRRRMDAQERAMKAPIKMLFPLVGFVFPALFVIILGPAALHMMQLLGNGS